MTKREEQDLLTLGQREFVLQELQFTEEFLNQFQFTTGTRFLEGLFPRGGEFEEAYLIHSRSPLFWAWWGQEFHLRSISTLNHVDKITFHNLHHKRNYYCGLMLEFVNSPALHHAFSNYIKTIQYGNYRTRKNQKAAGASGKVSTDQPVADGQSKRRKLVR